MDICECPYCKRPNSKKEHGPKRGRVTYQSEEEKLEAAVKARKKASRNYQKTEAYKEYKRQYYKLRKASGKI